MKNIRFKPARLFSIFMILAIVILTICFLLTGMGGILIVSDPIEKSDAIVVLSGGEGRLEEAARLYDKKMGGLVILTETGEVNAKFGKYSDIERFDAMLKLGIPAGALLVTEKTASSTMEEAHVIRKVVQPMNIKSLIIVTDPFHCFRTHLMFKEEFKDTDIKIMVHAIPGHWYKSISWWMSRDGWEATLGEYVRLFYYLLRYNI